MGNEKLNNIRINATSNNYYNPYGLIDILINGKPITARPYVFDSEVANQKTMRNAFGNFVKPIRASTSCPDCGQGMDVQFDFKSDPPFELVEFTCKTCYPDLPPLIDPFLNPVKTYKILPSDIDMISYDLEKPLDTTTPVSVKIPPKKSQIKHDDEQLIINHLIDEIKNDQPIEAPIVNTELKQEPVKPSKPSKQKPSKSQQNKQSKETVIKQKQTPELAVGMGEEIDFDDTDMIVK